MIISASRRTDIPCYYSEWFMNRLKAGYVLIRNPFNHAQISQIQLSPNIVDCIVFWTKDAENIMPRLKELDAMGYKYYFQFTLTPYDSLIEKNLRDKTELVETFINLSKTIGKDRVLWRYDPIVLNDELSVVYHKEHFIRFCEKLSPYTNNVTISFVDNYAKLKTNLIRDLSTEEIHELADFMGHTAKNFGLTINACCEKADLSKYNIGKATCIDKAVIERVCGYSLNLAADKNQREGCGCVESIDIGTYNTCLNGCIYCYANNGAALCERRHSLHNPSCELLIGTVTDGEKIIERKVKSYRKD